MATLMLKDLRKETRWHWDLMKEKRRLKEIRMPRDLMKEIRMHLEKEMPKGLKKGKRRLTG